MKSTAAAKDSFLKSKPSFKQKQSRWSLNRFTYLTIQTFRQLAFRSFLMVSSWNLFFIHANGAITDKSEAGYPPTG